jgi:hypothetical protein
MVNANDGGSSIGVNQQKKPDPASAPPPPSPGRNTGHLDKGGKPADSGTGATPPPPVTNPPLTSPPIDIPDVPGGAKTPGKGVTTVNTKAMDLFSQNVQKLFDPIMKSHEDLAGVNIKAGWFNTARVLADKFNGASDGKGNHTGAFTEQLSQQLYLLAASLQDLSTQTEAVAQHYKKAEDLNHMTAKDFDTYIGGKVVPPPTPGATGSTSGG